MFVAFRRAVGAAALFLVALATPAWAGTASFSGVMTGATPQMPVVTISPPNCVSQAASPVHYVAYQFSVDVTGSYTIDVSGSGTFSVYLFANSFNPAAAFPTCVAADNNAPIQVVFGLTAGTTYFVVPFDDTFAQLGGTYSGTISGPGNITILGAPGPIATPALSDASLALLAGMLALAGWFAARRRNSR